jgi:hypothetical protein
MDPYETLGITPAYEGDLRALRNRLVKRYFEAGETPDEERLKAINIAYAMLQDAPRPRVVVPLEIISSTLPAARVGEPYRVALTASGGAEPYTWEAVLPRGLALDDAGVLSGHVERTLAFTLKVIDRDGRLAERGLVVPIQRPPVRVATVIAAAAEVPERRRRLHPAALATVILAIAALLWLVVALV